MQMGELNFHLICLPCGLFRISWRKGDPDDNDSVKKILTERLQEAQQDRVKDSPIFQMIEGFPEIQHMKTDIFRDTSTILRRV